MSDAKRVVLITGGSEGLGREICSLLSLTQSNVVVALSNNQSCLTETGQALGCDCFYCDITDYAQVEKVVKDVAEKYGKIDVLVNNAGVYINGSLEDNNADTIAKVVLVNTVGTIYMTKAVVPYMKAQKSGKIVNIDSVNGVEYKAHRSVYAASKWGINGFSGSLRRELAQFNIGVYAIFPGLMKTNLFNNANAKRNMEDAMDPKDVAKIVEFVTSFDSIVFEQVVFRNLSYDF